MRSDPIERVWIDPPKYWAATKNMSPEQVEQMLDEIMALVETGDREALGRIDFLSLESRTNKVTAA
jgi:hypothetical protein